MPSATPRFFRVTVEVDDLEARPPSTRSCSRRRANAIPAHGAYFDCGGVILALQDVSRAGLSPHANAKSLYFAVKTSKRCTRALKNSVRWPRTWYTEAPQVTSSRVPGRSARSTRSIRGRTTCASSLKARSTPRIRYVNSRPRLGAAARRRNAPVRATGARARPRNRCASEDSAGSRGRSVFRQRHGFFAKAGLDADIQTFDTGPAIAAAIVAGALDIGYGTVDALAAIYVKNVPLAIIAPSAEYISPDTAGTSGLLVARRRPCNQARISTAKSWRSSRSTASRTPPRARGSIRTAAIPPR